jgi:hypothetical protein
MRSENKAAHIVRAAAICAATGWALTAGSALAGVSQSGEAKNMHRVGHTDLQGRPSYQPNVIQYPDGRYVAFAGTHNGSAPNPLNGGAIENNGTIIIDVTDPQNPKETFHFPAPAGGQAQMVRPCLGSQLPHGVAGKVYLLRNVQGGASSGYEVWDVTNINAPHMTSNVTGLRSTHKDWWECSTGIAYMPGSKATPPLWRQQQSMVIMDWSNPEAPPVYLRTFGLPGGQPGAVGPVPPSLHGAISAHDHPDAAKFVARGATSSDVIGNRVYAAWGVGDDGVVQILDRSKLLPPPNGTWAGSPDTPTDAELLAPQVGIMQMSPDQGGHTTFPVFGMRPPSYASYSEFKTRDILVVASEATSNKCQEPPHWSFLVDITVENSKTSPPGTRVETYPWQGPMVLSTLPVDPRSGEKYPRGNYCSRGARFGSHSSEENFRNPFYGKLTANAHFTGGVRIWDIREPQAPVEVAFYVPEANANTVQPDGYMTNNVEIDNRGYIYVTDRNGSGFDILELMGQAKDIGFGPRP